LPIEDRLLHGVSGCHFCRQGHFTENTLRSILPVLFGWDLKVIIQVWHLWCVVLSASRAGTSLLAFRTRQIAIFQTDVQQFLTDFGIAHPGAGFEILFTRATFASRPIT
jgi:hypothetical protein